MPERGGWTTELRPLDVSEIVRVLDRNGVRHVLVGGVAAMFYGYSGSTFGADIVPDLAADNVNALAAALQDSDARVYSDTRRSDLGRDGTPPEAADFDLSRPESLRSRLRWYLSTRAGRLDVLQVIDGPGGYRSLVGRAVSTTISGVELLIISLPDLIESKETAGRPKDLAALDELRRLLGERE